VSVRCNIAIEKKSLKGNFPLAYRLWYEDFFFSRVVAARSFFFAGVWTLREGSADFVYDERRLSIVCGGRAEIDWESFSIGSGDEVFFSQSSAASLAVNRVVSEAPSALEGRLVANGRVVLINPNGVLIGKQGSVDAASFIASAFDLLERGPDLHFAGRSSGSIVNEGKIHARAGDAFLIGASVENRGELSALEGAAGLFAGRDVSVGTAESDRIHFCAASGEGFPACKASHFGSLASQRETGGGEIFILGEHVEVAGVVEASHPVCGGAIWIGGGERGRNPLIGNAKRTWIDSAADLRASALTSGQGGRVVVWAEEATGFFGQIAAEGGALGGDGGFVEVSGAKSLAFQGKVSTWAPFGKTGELLLDPNDILINAGATSGGAFAGAFFDGAGFQPATLNNTELGAALGMNNVTVATNAPTAGGSGDITFQANVAWAAAGNSLTVNAVRDIIVQDGVSVAAAGAGANITFNAGRNIDCRGAVRNNESATSTGGALILTAATGSITVGSAASAVVPSGAVANIFGAIVLSAPVGDISILGGAVLNSYAIVGNDNNGFGVFATSAGDILISSGRDFLMRGGSAGSTMTSVSRLPIPPVATPAMATNVTGNITVNAARDMTVQSGTAGPATRGDGAFIGHGMGGGYRGDNTAQSRMGNILVNVGRNLTMIHSRVTSVINGDPASIPFIGTNRVTSALLGYAGRITVNVGNDLNMQGLPAAGRVNTPIIGSFSTGASPPGPEAGNYQIPLYINVGRDFIMDGRNCSQTIGTQNNGANAAFPTEFFVHVGRNWVLLSGNAPALSANLVLVRHNTASVNMRYQAWAGSNIVCVNGQGNAGGGFAELHLPTTFNAALQRVMYDTNVRAGGDIRVAGGFPVVGVTYSSVGGIFYQADSPFAAGELWAAQSAIVNGVNIFAGTPLGTASPAFASDGLGAIQFDFRRNNTAGFSFVTLQGNVPTAPGAIPIVYQAHNGQDITMLTMDLFASLPGPADLTTGTGNGQISFDNSPRATAPQMIPIAGRHIRIDPFRNITVTGASLTAPAGNILAVANNNFSVMTNANITASGSVSLVCDNQAPVPPLIGPGGFLIDDTSQINAGTTIRIFTALPNNPPIQNNVSLLALINGQTIGNIALAFGFPNFPGNPFLSDSALEIYCTYYNVPAGDIYAGSPFGGVPFTIFYKPCLERVANEATIVIDEFLADFHPYNEFPGWQQRFLVKWEDKKLANEPYYLRRRHLNVINQPKTFTVLQLN
jgi:filamentous hemagglutinin family protein